MQIHLADVGLPVHPTLRHPITGAPLQAIGVTADGRAIWPVMGGSQPLGEQQPGSPPSPPQPNPNPGPPPGPPQPGPNPNPAAAIPLPPGPIPPQLPGAGNGEHGYPENTPLAQMSVEQQAAYWRHYARRNEDRLKQMADYAQLKEQAEAYQKYLQESQTEQQKAIVEAEQRGRKTALAEAGGHMVEAYVRAAATGRMTEEQVSTLLQGLDRTRFVNPATGQVDAQMVSAYVGMLAPAPVAVTYPPQFLPQPGMAQPVPPAGQPLTYPPAGQPQQPVQWNGYPPQQLAGQPMPGDPNAQRQVPSYGQAQYPIPQARGLEAGRAVARERFAKKSTQ